MGLFDDVRRRCAAIAGAAQHVRIDLSAPVEPGGTVGFDPHLVDLDAPLEERARFVLILDAINFGSGWFDELGTGTDEMTRRLSARGSPWTAAELRELGPGEVAAVLGQGPDHALMALYARALNELGEWLGERPALEAVATTGAEALAVQLAALRSFDDPGFYKRAQIAANDLVLAGVATYADVDRLTIFADNLVPHVLRVDGVLRYDDTLAARVDAGEELARGSREEVEIRACAVHACEAIAARLGVPPRILDNWLWNRGQGPPYSDALPHRTCTTAY